MQGFNNVTVKPEGPPNNDTLDKTWSPVETQ